MGDFRSEWWGIINCKWYEQGLTTTKKCYRERERGTSCLSGTVIWIIAQKDWSKVTLLFKICYFSFADRPLLWHEYKHYCATNTNLLTCICVCKNSFKSWAFISMGYLGVCLSCVQACVTMAHNYYFTVSLCPCNKNLKGISSATSLCTSG